MRSEAPHLRYAVSGKQQQEVLSRSKNRSVLTQILDLRAYIAMASAMLAHTRMVDCISSWSLRTKLELTLPLESQLSNRALDHHTTSRKGTEDSTSFRCFLTLNGSFHSRTQLPCRQTEPTGRNSPSYPRTPHVMGVEIRDIAFKHPKDEPIDKPKLFLFCIR